jgi:hypothetical protein
MPNNSEQRSMLVLDEVFGIWKDFDPVECYAAGFDDCKGKLFIPTQAANAELLRRVENARSRLSEVQDVELRSAANKLLSSTSVAIAHDSPEEQIVACFLAIWYSLLKSEHHEPFVETLLEQASELVTFEHSRWFGQQFSGETRKAVVDACFSLDAILVVLASKNPELIDSIGSLTFNVANFRSLFSFPLRNPTSFEELFEFFEKNAGPPRMNKLYPQIIAHVFDYGVSIDEIYTKSQNLLEEELDLAKGLIPTLNQAVGAPQWASLGDAYDALSKRYEISGPVVIEAQKMMDVLNRFIDRDLQDIGIDPNILPEATPEFLKPLITSGAAIALNYLRKEPSVTVFVTEERNTSWLTLLNVLVHEATHAYSPLILARIPTVPVLTKLKSWLALPFYEATAFHRELELFEAIQAGAKQRHRVSRTVNELLGLFDTPVFPLRDDVIAFELETRIWRIIRALRTICDVEVNTAKRTYVDFIKWAAAHTGLSKELIHHECFTFLSYPGYTPSYSFCGLQYQELQKEAKEKRRVSRHSFNTKANQIGLLPWTLCVERMKRFR